MRVQVDKVERSRGVRWRARIYIEKHEGGPRRVHVGHYARQGEAFTAGDEALGRLKLELGLADPEMTVAGLLERWFADHASGRLKPRTLERYRQIIDQHLLPHLGAEVAHQLTPAACSRFQANLEDGSLGVKLGPSSIRQARSILYSAYEWAIELGLVAVNPWRRVKPPALPDGRVKPPSPAEMRVVIDAARGTQLHAPLLLATTGARRGEVLALRWSDIDLEGHTLVVCRSLAQTKQGLSFTSPKTAAGNRRLALSRFVARQLRDLKRERISQARRAGVPWSDEELVCRRVDGGPLPPDQVSHNFYHLLRRKGLAPMRLHDFRHASVSFMLDHLRPDAVARHHGHEDPAFTVRRYGHLVDRVEHEVADAFGEALEGVGANRVGANRVGPRRRRSLVRPWSASPTKRTKRTTKG